MMCNSHLHIHLQRKLFQLRQEQLLGSLPDFCGLLFPPPGFVHQEALTKVSDAGYLGNL